MCAMLWLCVANPSWSMYMTTCIVGQCGWFIALWILSLHPCWMPMLWISNVHYYNIDVWCHGAELVYLSRLILWMNMYVTLPSPDLPYLMALLDEWIVLGLCDAINFLRHTTLVYYVSREMSPSTAFRRWHTHLHRLLRISDALVYTLMIQALI